MSLAAFLIGLREGLEAALIVGILIAFVRRQQRVDVVPRIWWGVGLAVALSVGVSAVFTFGASELSEETQEIIAGVMSLIAVALVTWMVFWMMRVGYRLKSELEGSAAEALTVGAGSAIATIAFLAVGREGLETALMLWGWAMQPDALLGAAAGIAAAIVLGYLVYRGMLRVNLGTFFAVTGAALVVLAAGILAYGVHELQEATILPGPYSGAPIAPLDPATGEVLVGLFSGPSWFAAVPFGWAFDLRAMIDPDGVLATVSRATIGLTPRMSWLEVIAWAVYLLLVLPRFLHGVRAQRSGRPRKDVPADDRQAAELTSPAVD